MDDQPTCGKGLAANSALPAKLEDLTAAMAQVLEAHVKALDLSEGNARTEHAVYQKLLREYRTVADQLHGSATEMAGYRDLPMARHDPRAMVAREPLEAFGRLLHVEEELLQLLQSRLDQDRGMLLQMERAHRGAS